MTIQRFLIECDVENSGGSQIFYADAESEAEAIEMHKRGESEFYEDNSEVTGLGLPEIIGTTSLDDRPPTWDEVKPLELRLCETERLGLQPNRTYLFTVDPTCARCVELAERNTPPKFEQQKV